MRSILINADRKPGMESRLELATGLARHTGGHLTVLVDTPASRYIAMDPMGGSYVIADALDKAREDDDAAAKAIETILARQDVPFDLIRSEDEPVSALAIAARLSDLVIVSRESGIAGALAMEARVPVLALPDPCTITLPPRVACIAWDGGDQAAAALRASVPFLLDCPQVKVISVIEKAGGFPATDALRYLSRHGISAELEEHERRGSTEETLAVAVSRAKADVLVMGAYGKSRMREFLFGGVTAYYLTEAGGPALFLMH